jgi:polyisoprenyl-teichoic acid--peptidoglycan teichoic acid transferase
MTPAPLSLRAFGHRVLVALLISGVILAAVAVAVVRTENAKVASIAVAPIDASLLRAGGNYLIIGSDTRAFGESQADIQHFGSAATQQGQRSDTMMVAHIDPGKHTGVLVSFPRDLWEPIPGHGTSKINAAFAYGGAQLAIRTIEQDFDIPISHYLEVDFAGFRDIVDAIGSVPIYFPTPARDHNTGLLITTPGCHNLNGTDALAYVRSRYYEYESGGKWQYDPTSDLGRINRQQYFIRSLSRAAIHSVLSSPFKINGVVDKSVKSLTRDKSLSTSDMKALVRAFRNTDPNAFPMYTLPATNGFRDSQSVLLLDDAKAAPILARLRPTAPDIAKPPPGISPSSVSVVVQNGSGRTGAAKRVLGALTAAGFKRGGPATDADRSDYLVTEVRYASSAEGKARVVLAHLGGAGKLVPVNSTPGGVDVIVVLGQDFHAAGSATAAAATTTTPPAAPTTHRPAGAGTTTTTGPPANPGGVMPVAGC